MAEATKRKPVLLKLLKVALWYAPFLFCCGVIFWLSSMNHPPIPRFMRFPNGDKVLHLVAYFLVGASASLPFLLRSNLAPLLGVIQAILLATLFGVSDEFHQAFVPQREVSFGDLCADFLGASAGAFSVFVLLRIIRLITQKKTLKSKEAEG